MFAQRRRRCGRDKAVPNSRSSKRGSHRGEVLHLTEKQVERQVALKWVAYAKDAYAEYKRTGKLDWLIRAHGYRAEALEHAGQVGDYGKFVGECQRQIDGKRR